jgi:hypothetical protein
MKEHEMTDRYEALEREHFGDPDKGTGIYAPKNHERLIAQQALLIDRLRQEIADCKSDMAEISMILCCIGGPLNDNVLGYSADQRKPLHRINNLAEPWRDQTEGA